MKILLCGVFGLGSTDTHKLTALRRAGHRVVPHPYRDRDVREIAAQGQPFDLVLVSKGVPLSEEQWRHLATLGRAHVLYWPDPIANWTAECHAAVFDLHFQLVGTSRPVMEKICELDNVTGYGVRVLEGADCTGFIPPEFPEPKRALLHFGHMSERRAEVIDGLRSEGIEVTHLDQPHFGKRLQDQVLAHAAVLGINSSPDLMSNRVQTVLAMGGMLLQEAASDGPRGLDDWPTFKTWTTPGFLALLAHDAMERPRRSTEHAVAAYVKFSWDRWAREIVDAVEKVEAA